MSLLTHLDDTFSHAEDLNAIDKLKSFVDPELLQQAYELSGVATVRRRRLPLDSVVFTIVGMSLFRMLIGTNMELVHLHLMEPLYWQLMEPPYLHRNRST